VVGRTTVSDTISKLQRTLKNFAHSIKRSFVGNSDEESSPFPGMEQSSIKNIVR
jgi:hypothetical protein